MSRELAEHLRRQASQQDMLTCEDMLKGADEIERLDCLHAAKDAEIERLQRENDALYDMLQGMKINLTKILDGRRALETKP